MHYRHQAIGGFLIALTAFSGLSSMAEEQADTQALVRDNSTFAIEFYRSLADSHKGNLFFSPHSISTALAMTYAGARGNTEAEMAATLRFQLGQERLHPAFAGLEAMLGEVQKQGNVELHAANSLWPQVKYTFLDEYLALAKKHYGVSISPVDYGDSESARKTINQWVEGKTKDRIKELIPPGILNDLTLLVLVNAIYFKGKWQSEFDAAQTKATPFHLSYVKSVRVEMMKVVNEFRYAESKSLQVLELPYDGGELSMLILLPREIDGIGKLEKHLTLEGIDRCRNLLSMNNVDVLLPKFKVTSMLKLGKILSSMGMIDAFDSQGKADFSGLDGSRLLYIAAVIHQAFVEVNESGTEAAAATAVVMDSLGMDVAPVKPKRFRANRPFLFIIQENTTGCILFMGRVVDPSMAGE